MDPIKYKIIAIFTVMLLITSTSYAFWGKVQNYGEEITNREITPISDVLIKPADYEGKDVTLEGKIVTLCPSGCWLELEDDSGLIYIDLGSSGVSIPQKRNHRATIQGSIQLEGPRTIMNGRGVEIK